MLNHVIIMGRLCSDPELKTTPSGVPVTTIRLAVDRDFKNKETGERETDFINVVTWRQTAEFVNRYFTKGRVAVAEGRLQVRQYTDKDGNKRTAVDVVADNVYFGDSKSAGTAQTDPLDRLASDADAAGLSTPAGAGFADASGDDSDLPF